MKIIVTGGRDFTDREFIFATLDRLHAERPITLLMHGAAKGADELAGQWAESRKVPSRRFPADWKKHGKAAGPIRNAEMLAGNPYVVVEFPGGRGTANMAKLANDHSVAVITPEYPPPS